MSTRSITSLPPLESRFGTASTHSNGPTVAAERWNVEKKRLELDDDIERFYNAKVAKCLEVDKIANEKITKLYNDIYYKAKWSNPPMPVVIQKLFTEYSKHLLKEGPKVIFPGAVDLKVWRKKLVGSIHDKNAGETEKLCKQLCDTIQKRDADLINIQAQLITTTEKKNIKKDGTLRWMMEANVGKKDEYFTVWYLASHGKIRELEVLLNAQSKQAHIDDRDPDFGLTPLHYACKTVKLSMVQYLMSKGADIHLRTPDGRTPLHLAAAYSTREVVLELLGACIDYDAVDNYGCTALHMAEQNRNTSTLETLKKWTTMTMLPGEIEQMNSQRSPGSTAHSAGLSPHRSLSGVAGGTGSNSIAFVKSAEGALNLQVAASEMQLTVFEDFDPSVPWEYQPIPPDILKVMSPSLSLLTKRLNAYNMFHIRTESNYVPTEMLSSRDLRNISGMLHRSAASLLQASQVTSKPYPGLSQSQSQSQASLLLRPENGGEEMVGAQQSTALVLSSNNSFGDGGELQKRNSDNNQTDLYVNTAAPGEGLGGYDQYHPGNESEMFRSSYQSENIDYESEFNECLVEIRLTTKHYALCVQENLIQEAMRSLRRRWIVAKRLWDLIVREKRHRQQQEEQQRLEQEALMASLLADQEQYQMQYDEHGMPIVTAAGLLEASSSVTEAGAGANEEFNYMLGSEEAVNLSQPHPKYAPSLAEVSEQTSKQSSHSHPQTLSPSRNELRDFGPPGRGRGNSLLSDQNRSGVALQQLGGAFSPMSVDGGGRTDFSIHSQFDINPNFPQHEEDEECSADGSSSSASAGPAPPPFDLERIALCFEETQERNRQEELNPDPENQSSSTLKRPGDYDSLGVDVYKVRDNVYWETESSRQRMNAPPLSDRSSAGLSSHSDAPARQPASDIRDRSFPADTHASADMGTADTAAVEGEKILSFVPTAWQESDAWEVIQKWHLVADARARRRPNFDLYLASNDELISTSSQLTCSVTESPSTGGYGAGFGLDSFSQSGLDSPSSASLGSSYMLGQVQGYGHTAGPFKEKVRGNYVIKLGLDLMGVYIVRKEEGSALRVLHECCEIDDEVEVTQKIALLEKKNDLLLHIHDFLQRTVRDIEKSLQPPANASGPPRLKLHFPMARAEISVRTIVNDRVKEMLDSVEFVEAQFAYENDEERVLFLAPEENNDAGTGTLIAGEDVDDHMRELAVDVDRPGSDPAVKSSHGLDASGLQGDTLTNGSAVVPPTTAAEAKEEHQPSTPFALVTFTNPVDDRNALETESEQAIQRLQKAQASLLKQVVRLTDISVALHREHYKDDIAEPSTLAVALLQRARAAERAYDGAQAMRFTEQAEVAAVRALGGGSQLAISIMLETLRLYVKYHLAEPQDLVVISRKAAQINKHIVQFSFIDLQMADRFTQKSVEYVAISMVAIKHKEAEIARQVAAEKLAGERAARKKLLEAQQSVLKKGKQR